MKLDLIDLETEMSTRGKRRLNKLTASYLAGLIDGEGYIGIQKKNGYYRAALKIAMTHKGIIEWLKQSFGGSINTRDRSGENCKDCYQWECIGNKNAISILKAVYPYLKVKREQAKTLFMIEKTLTNQFDIKYIKLGYGQGKVRTLKKDIVQKREELYQELKRLNYRGRWQPERLNNLTG